LAESGWGVTVKRPGRIKEKLAEALSKELGTVITAYDFREAVGWWRTSFQSEALRWEVPSLGVGSWSTMTDCVRYGFDIERGSIVEPTTLGRAYPIAINARSKPT
jgi:hypothetical protein